ncbi:hypothetical protein ACTTAI_13340 [Rhodobacter capsulatus]|uniref:hypothetical protein n=1 Tax=Rhodobacter capsulatus TaxID=1061 RepID=UPI004026C738
MAKKPEPAAETGTVTAKVIDALAHDGETYGPGDTVELPTAEAFKLRSLGVVAFDDEATAPAPPTTAT